MYEPEPLDDDVPNPRIFTRVYMKNSSSSYDLDGDVTHEIITAIEGKFDLVKFDIPSCGEVFYLRPELIESFCLKSIDSMKRIWENERKWKNFHKNVVGYEDGV